MINFKKTKNLFSATLICVLASVALPSYGINKTVNKEVAQVDEVALEVQKINSLEDALDARERAQRTVLSYRITVRQLRKGMYMEDDAKATQEAVDVTQVLIREQERKIDLLDKKIELLKPVEEQE